MRAYKKAIVSIILVIPALSASAFAASNEKLLASELEYLSIYYPEKEIVVSTTRTAKLRSQAAENIFIITAKDIEGMGAHNINQVLRNVPGLFMNTSNDFSSPSITSILGSDTQEVLVLLDGVRWTYLSEGLSETSPIPLQIVERIEIIKGPASSTWGSSLGGVINIITKPTGENGKPEGTLYFSYGDANSIDANAQLAGKKGSVGYYLSAGRQESDGLLPKYRREYTTNNLFAKVSASITPRTSINISSGYSEPEMSFGDIEEVNMRSRFEAKAFSVTANTITALSRDNEIRSTLFYLKQKIDRPDHVLEDGFYGKSGELFLYQQVAEETFGGNIDYLLRKDTHSLTAGFELINGDVKHTIFNGEFLQEYGYLDDVIKNHHNQNRTAIYLNDTLLKGRWAITPGIRYDYDRKIEGVLSPSLGLTYEIQEQTLLRASAARGFAEQGLVFSEFGANFYDPNPDLKPVYAWAYQIGIESALIPYFLIKTTAFYFDEENPVYEIDKIGGPPLYNGMAINLNGLIRKGFEAELKTTQIHNFQFFGGFSYIRNDPQKFTGIIDSPSGYEEKQTRLSLAYDNKDDIYANIMGTYWEIEENIVKRSNGDLSDFVWDFHISKTLKLKIDNIIKLFFNAHNIFDGKQYYTFLQENPERWIEAGLTWQFK